MTAGDAPVLLIDEQSRYPAVIVGGGPDAIAAAMRYAALLDGYRDQIRALSASRNKNDRRFTPRSQGLAP